MKTKFILALAAGITGLAASANAALIAMDNFSGYVAASTSLNGQAGGSVPIGFAGTWVTPSSTAVIDGVLTTGADTVGRSYRAFATSVASDTSTLTISLTAKLPSLFSGIELAPNADSDQNSIRFCTNGGNIVIQGKGADGSEQNYVLNAIDSVSHTYSLELNSTTTSGRARVDTGSWVSFAFTNTDGFALNFLSVADFSSSSITLDNFSINNAAAAVPEPSSLGLLALGAGCLLARRRKNRKA